MSRKIYLTSQSGGDGGGIYTVDPQTTNPPELLISSRGHAFYDIALIGRVVYLTAHEGGIYKFNVDDAVPQLEAINSSMEYTFNQMLVDGQYLYLTTYGSNGYWKFDTNNQSAPPWLISGDGLGFSGICWVES